MLLAGRARRRPARPTPSGPSWEADREALAAGTLTLAELLARRGLVLRADLLVPWARWITPEGEPRRFDARFFAAALPAGQMATGHAAESDHIAWLRPADAIEAAQGGRDLAVPADGDDAQRLRGGRPPRRRRRTPWPGFSPRRRVIEPVMPRLVLEDGQAWLHIPDEVGYPL